MIFKYLLESNVNVIIYIYKMDSLLSSFEKINMDDTFTIPYIEDFNNLDITIKKLISNDFMYISNTFCKNCETNIPLYINSELISKMNKNMYVKMFSFLSKNGYKIFEIIIKEVSYKKYNYIIEDINIFTLYNNYMDLITKIYC